MTDNSDWSGSHMFDPECWADNELEGWPQRVESGIYASYYRLMPFASKSIRTTMTPDLGISFVTFSSVGQEGQSDQDQLDSGHAEDPKDIKPQSVDSKKDTSFVPLQSEQGQDRLVAKWEKMDKASQDRLTVYYRRHKIKRDDNHDMKLWNDISAIILKGKHSGSIQCKGSTVRFSCCNVVRVTGDMCHALVLADGDSKMWKNKADVQCRGCQSRIGQAAHHERWKHRIGKR